MRSRFAALAVAGLFILGVFAPTAALAARSSPTPPHKSGVFRRDFGPPLGYYGAALEDCQDNPWYFYHDQNYYRGCEQARAVVQNQLDRCSLLTDLGIGFAWASWDRALLYGIYMIMNCTRY